MVLARNASACPDANGLVDLNCDGQVLVLAFGDSITDGERDSTGLGYPGRLNQLLPQAEVVNLGVSGEETRSGRSRASREFSRRSEADYIVILEGVNDYFSEDRSSSYTRSNLYSMVSSGENTGAITLLAKLTAVRRSYQKSWVRSVNNAIASRTRVDFYSLGEGIISGDLLHPDNGGYQEMAELLASVLINVGEANRPVDRDGDGLYDFAESRYGTSVTDPDSDNDGLDDSDEVFLYGSNPLVVDTDGDGFTDAYEALTLGSDPANPLPGAPVVSTIEAIL